MLPCATQALEILERVKKESRICQECGWTWFRHSEFGDLCPVGAGKPKTTFKEESRD